MRKKFKKGAFTSTRLTYYENKFSFFHIAVNTQITVLQWLPAGVLSINKLTHATTLIVYDSTHLVFISWTFNKLTIVFQHEVDCHIVLVLAVIKSEVRLGTEGRSPQCHNQTYQYFFNELCHGRNRLFINFQNLLVVRLAISLHSGDIDTSRQLTCSNSGALSQVRE